MGGVAMRAASAEAKQALRELQRRRGKPARDPDGVRIITGPDGHSYGMRRVR